MARFYPFSFELDGKRYRGEWTLLQGYRVCVRWAYGSGSAGVGNDTPERAASLTLERMVRAAQKRRTEEEARFELEKAKYRRPQKPR